MRPRQPRLVPSNSDANDSAPNSTTLSIRRSLVRMASSDARSRSRITSFAACASRSSAAALRAYCSCNFARARIMLSICWNCSDPMATFASSAAVSVWIAISTSRIAAVPLPCAATRRSRTFISSASVAMRRFCSSRWPLTAAALAVAASATSLFASASPVDATAATTLALPFSSTAAVSAESASPALPKASADPAVSERDVSAAAAAADRRLTAAAVAAPPKSISKSCPTATVSLPSASNTGFRTEPMAVASVLIAGIATELMRSAINFAGAVAKSVMFAIMPSDAASTSLAADETARLMPRQISDATPPSAVNAAPIDPVLSTTLVNWKTNSPSPTISAPMPVRTNAPRRTKSAPENVAVDAAAATNPAT